MVPSKRHAYVPVLAGVLALAVLAFGLAMGWVARWTPGEPASVGGNAAASGPSPNVAQTAPPPDSPPAVRSRLRIGLHHEAMPHDPPRFDRWWEEQQADLDWLHWTEGWPNGAPGPFPVELARRVHAAGAVPVISWEPRDPGWIDPDVAVDPDAPPATTDLRHIAEGRADPGLQRWAAGAAELDETVLVRPLPDANGDWYPWGGLSTEEEHAWFRQSWRRISEALDEAGAANVVLVWSVAAGESFEAEQVRQLHPGNEHADLSAVTALDWGSHRPWGEPDADLDPGEALDVMADLELESLVFAGVATPQRQDDPQRERVRRLERRLQQRDGIAGVVWMHDRIDEVDFRLSPAARAAATARPDREGRR